MRTIKVYLTQREKRNLKREAKATGITMSSLAAHKFISNANKEFVYGGKTKNKTTVFNFSISANLRGRVEYAALKNNTTLTEFVRELVTNN